MRSAVIGAVVVACAVGIAVAVAADKGGITAQSTATKGVPASSAGTGSVSTTGGGETAPAAPTEYDLWVVAADKAARGVKDYARAMDRCIRKAGSGDAKAFLPCETAAYRHIRKATGPAISAAKVLGTAAPGPACSGAADRYRSRLSALSRVAQYLHISARLSSEQGVRDYLRRLPRAAARFGAVDTEVRGRCGPG